MVREGTDVSIFTYSRMRYVVMQAVAELEKRGYNPEVGALLRLVWGAVSCCFGGAVLPFLSCCFGGFVAPITHPPNLPTK